MKEGINCTAKLNINSYWFIQWSKPKLFFLLLGLIIENDHICRDIKMMQSMSFLNSNLQSHQQWLINIVNRSQQKCFCLHQHRSVKARSCWWIPDLMQARMENATVLAVMRSCLAASIGSQHHMPEQARYWLKTDYPKQSRMLLQTTPTQQSVRQKPRGGKLDSENSSKKLTLNSIGM